MLVAKPRNRKWRLISRTCCPPPAAALRAAWGACGALGRAARACFWRAASTEKLPFCFLDRSHRHHRRRLPVCFAHGIYMLPALVAPLPLLFRPVSLSLLDAAYAIEAASYFSISVCSVFN